MLMSEKPVARDNDLKSGLGKDSLQAVFSLLKESHPSEILSSQLRLLARGLFVGESFLEIFTTVYQKWHYKQTGSHAFQNPEKCRKHFFGTLEPGLFYLIEGKNCLVGYFIPADSAGLSVPGASVFHGSLTPVSGSLHPRDPVLQSIHGLNARLDPHKGLELSLTVRGCSYGLSLDFLQQFVSVIQKSRRLSREFPEATRGPRSSFPALSRILAVARSGRGRRKYLIPARFRNQPDKILIYKRLRLVLGQNHELSQCYELRADNLEQFVEAETELLRRNRRATRIGPFSVALKSGPSVGFLRIRGKSYRISRSSFQQFLSQLLRMRTPPRELPAAYTLYDTFSLLARISQKGHWVPRRDIPRALYDRLEGHESVLQSRDWVFIVSLDTVEKIELRSETRN